MRPRVSSKEVTTMNSCSATTVPGAQCAKLAIYFCEEGHSLCGSHAVFQAGRARVCAVCITAGRSSEIKKLRAS